MLLGMIVALSVLGALGICLAVGFGWQWLWLLPISFAGGFLGLLGLAFLFLWLVCALARTDTEQKEDSRFYRCITNLYIEAMIPLVRLRVETEGLEKTPKEGRFLLVCNHLHEADPVLLLHFFKKSQLAFISKRENATMFLVGKLMPKLLCQLVNRENDREALKTIVKCIQLIREDKVSVAVFPEGYIHPQRKFQHLRPGVFKIAQKANVPIVVCTIQNTHNILKNFLKFKPTTVKLHLLEVLPVTFLEGKTTVEIAEYVHTIMEQDLGAEYRLEENT